MKEGFHSSTVRKKEKGRLKPYTKYGVLRKRSGSYHGGRALLYLYSPPKKEEKKEGGGKEEKGKGSLI